MKNAFFALSGLILLAACSSPIEIGRTSATASWPINAESKEPFLAQESVKYPLDDGEMAVCLSGGGYRATLFHLGALWMLNDAGMLEDVKRVVGVSGGAITAAALGIGWDDLEFDSEGIASNFEEKIASPLLSLTSHTIDFHSILIGVLTPSTVAKQLSSRYDKYVFGNSRLSDLPDHEDGPAIVLLASEARTSMQWMFTKHMILAERLANFETDGPGSFVIPYPDFKVSHAVAASAGFPPVLGPLTVSIPDPSQVELPQWAPGVTIEPEIFDIGGETIVIEDNSADLIASALHRDDLHEKLQLIDGGVLSNTGAEFCTGGDRYLVSSAATINKVQLAASNWFSAAAQTATLIYSRSESLQRAEYRDEASDGCSEDQCKILVNLYEPENNDGIDDFNAALEQQQVQVDTRLKRLPEFQVQLMINWGYSATAERIFGEDVASTGLSWPYPQQRYPYCLPEIGDIPIPDGFLEAAYEVNYSSEMIDLILDDEYGQTTKTGSCDGKWGSHDCTQDGCRYFSLIGHCEVLSGPYAGFFGSATRLGGCLVFDEDIRAVQCDNSIVDGERCRVYENLVCEAEDDDGEIVRGKADRFYCVTEDEQVIDCEGDDGGLTACRYSTQ
ncbi:MAG: patatin-like phospholipase family protein [Pseudomonadota bacterium]